MTGRRKRSGRAGLYFITFVWLILIVPFSVAAAPYAAMVMDARSGEILHSENADTRLHPASLTKMMTLYIVFEAVQNGELSMDSVIKISRRAVAEPPSKLGLREGQKIKLRYLVRAAAVKSANDAATALAEAVSGSEAAFARRMNRTAKALGMTRTTFKNAHGLTESGHLSTARDMTILGRHVLYDYPQYYNLFSRRSADAGIKTVPNTNRRLLAAYKGADGIKTGYTRAAGFNLVASAERGRERVIATVFGGRSTATRNARVAELLDLGFRKAPSRVALRAPRKPAYVGNSGDVVVAKTSDTGTGTRGKSIRVASAAVTRSLRPTARAVPAAPADTAPIVAALQNDIRDAIQEIQDVERVAAVVEAVTRDAAAPPGSAAAESGTSGETDPAMGARIAAAPAASVKPVRRPADLVLASVGAMVPAAPARAEVVERVSTSGGRHWGVNVGRFPSRYAAEKELLRVALAEMTSLDGSLRKVVRRNTGFDANFMGLTRDTADLACRRLQARQTTCFMIGPN